MEVWRADSSSSPPLGVSVGGRTLSSRGKVNLTINNLLSICIYPAQCVVKGFGGGCSPGSTHIFFLLAIVLHRQLQSPPVWPQLCCPRFAHSGLLVEQLRRAAQSLWTSCFVHLSHLFCFHLIQELLEDWVPMESWKNFQFSRTSFSRQIVGVVTFKNYGRQEKAMCTDLIGLRLTLSNHFQS